MLYPNNVSSQIYVDIFQSGTMNADATGPNNMFLTADIELLYKTHAVTNGNLTLGNAVGSGCKAFASFSGSVTCPNQTESYPIFATYNNSMAAWYANFSTAYQVRCRCVSRPSRAVCLVGMGVCGEGV